MKLKNLVLFVLMFIVMCTTVVFATEVEDFDVTSEIMPISETDGVPLQNVEVIDNDYFSVDENINLNDMYIDGNLFVVGGTAKLSNIDVSGSIFAVTQNLELSNVNVDGSLYVVGNNVNSKQTFFKNIYSVTQNINLSSETNVGQNFYAVAGNCKIDSKINNNSGIIGKNISVGSDAVVIGELNVMSDEEPNISNDSNIGNYKFVKNEKTEVDPEFNINFYLSKILGYIVSTLVITFVIIKAMPKFKEKAKEYTVKNYLLNMLWGFLSIIAVPIVVVLFMVTGVGVRLGLILSLIYILVFFIATPITCALISIAINKKLDKEENKFIYIIALAVSGVVAILSAVPVLSGFITVIFGLFGIGTIFTMPFAKEKTQE